MHTKQAQSAAESLKTTSCPDVESASSPAASSDDIASILILLLKISLHHIRESWIVL